MSPSGEISRSGPPTPLEAFAVGSSVLRSAGKSLLRSERPTTALPIRLSVAQGGLGIELAEPIQLPIVVVEELDVALLGVKYPVDLSKGVKQFRNRRSRLRRAVLRVDLTQLAQGWAEALVEFWGEEVKLRLRPIFERSRSDVESRTSPVPANESGEISAISVSIYSQTTSLAFDLVLSSGNSPRFVVDCPRLSGRSDAPLPFVLRCLDEGLTALNFPGSGLKRQGRALEISRLSEALTLAVLPALGCRLPEVEGQVVQRVGAMRGSLLFTLGLRSEPFPAGLRALRVSGFADFVLEADTLLVSGDSDGARSSYLRALEAAEGHPGILQELAELDLAYEHRAESALSFLSEIRAEGVQNLSAEAESRYELALSRALFLKGRKSSGAESLGKAFILETDAVFGAALGLELSRVCEEPEQQRELLDQAIGRAPFLAAARMKRIVLALKEGDLDVAVVHAERIEAEETHLVARASNCTQMGELFSKAGHPEMGRSWLKRALRFRPDELKTMLALATSYALSGENLRAAELYQSALRVLSRRIEEYESSERAPGTLPTEEPLSHLRSQRSEARYCLAELYIQLGDEDEQALGLLSGVETRSCHGGKARLLEARLHDVGGRALLKEKALMRLLEAIELGWIELEVSRAPLVSFFRAEGKGCEPSLLEFAQKVLGPFDWS